MRTFTREQVAQVVEQHIGDNGVRTILRDLDALPEADVQEVPAPVSLTARRTPDEESRSATLFISFEGLSKTCSNEECRERVLGSEVGRLDARLDAGPETFRGSYRTANLEWLRRVADGHGYTMQTERSPDPYWTYVEFARKPSTPRLSVVPSNPPAVPESSPESKRPILDLYGLKGAIQRPRATTPTPESSTLSSDDVTRLASEGLRLRGALEQRLQRQRRPEPVPEVPALKEGACTHAGIGLPGCLTCDPRTVSEGGPRPDHAPDVVWSGDGVRVLADGTWEFVSGGTYHEGFNALARALAEAKRETGILKVAAEGQLKTTNSVERANAELAWGVAGSMQSALRRERSLRQEVERELRCDHGQPKEYCAQSFNDAMDAAKCETLRRFASRLGDDATGYDTDRSLEELEVALYQHVLEQEENARNEASESMRERAAKYIEGVARDGRTDEIRSAAAVLSAGIRALSLEEP